MRIRITFARQGDLRFTGNLDLQKLWERAARRARLPLVYSQGFHPQPKISLASALPLGFASRAEVLDMRLAEERSIHGIAAQLNAVLPTGLRVLEVSTVSDAAPALQSELLAAEYEATVDAGIDSKELQGLTDQTVSLESIPRVRRDRHYDLRPLILELRVLVPARSDQDDSQRGGPRLWMRLAAREGATGRPEEVLAAMGLSDTTRHIERTALLFTWGRIPT